MYLKALEIQGFKSFPDKTVLTFEEPVTAIVGPNGSGKSNLSDAVRWVMGEQSTRNLRGGKMEDVIFGGTQKRKPLGYAEVTLVLDNSSGFFRREESELAVTRRYYRSGESEYCINRCTCRLKDINELLMDTGLGKEGYSIIGQGRIDEILSTKGTERRSVFEEAAGISKVRHKKEEAEHRLERTMENLLRVGDKISELELQIEPLREQSGKAKRYLALKEEQKKLEIALWLEQLDGLRTQKRKLEQDWENAVRQREEAGSRQTACYARAEALLQRMQQEEEEAQKLREQVRSMETQLSEGESALAVLSTQMQRDNEQKVRLGEELEEQEGRGSSLQEQMSQRKAALAEMDVRKAELKSRMEGHKNRLSKLREQAQKLDEELDALHREETVQTASAAEAKAMLSAIAASEQELHSRGDAITVQLEQMDQTLAETHQSAVETEQALGEVRQQAQGIGNVIAGYQLRLNSRQGKLDTLREEHNRTIVELGTVQGRIKLLREMEQMYEGYSKAVKTVLQAAEHRQLRGIHGPVANLIHVQQEYTVAVETALGSSMQHIVVEREEDGKDAIQYLKRRSAGRATFLPLTAVRGSRLRETDLEQQSGYIGLGAELVQSAPGYRGIVDQLLGRVVVVEDMDSAIAMARYYHHRFRIVTLDGQVLNPGGSMTGGSAGYSAGVLSRANELEQLGVRLEQVKHQAEEQAKRLETAQRDAQAAAYEMENARQQKQTLEQQVLRLEGQQGQYRALMDTMQAARESAVQEQNGLTLRLAGLKTDWEAAAARIASLEGQAEAARQAAESRSQGQANFSRQAAAVTETLSGLNVELAALEAEQSAGERALLESEQLYRQVTGDRESRAQQIALLEAHTQTLLEQESEKRTQLTQLQVEKEQKNEQLQQLIAGRLALEAKRTQADQEAREQNEGMLRIERECSLLEQKKNGVAMEEKQLLDKLWDSYELTYDSAQRQAVELDSGAKAQRRVAEIKKEVSALGNVNLGAIEEFQRVSERYDYLSTQRDDVEHAKKELEGIISGITEEMKRIFSEQFHLIGEAFSQTFRELFGGGKATLELGDEKDILNCDIEIKVQPPGKALKVLSLLSGGEKAFVAIALYFAFIKVRPTPFVVMDEIEAALDDNNVVRFAQYVRTVCDKTQFIVITHRRGTMEEADVLYGVTMQEKGVSSMITVDLNQMSEELKLH